MSSAEMNSMQLLIREFIAAGHSKHSSQ